VQYAGGKTNRLSLGADDKLTVTEIRKAVRSLKKAKARMFNATSDGKSRKPHFICICSPDATYDLQSDALWQDVSKYSDVEQIYSGEIGRLFGVVFVESTEAKIFRRAC
jgi:N4-gp56 family major capsid protein